MKNKVKVVRRTITLPKMMDDELTKQARKKGMKTPTYCAQLLREFASVPVTKTKASAVDA